MLYSAPSLDEADERLIGNIDRLCEKLAGRAKTAQTWTGVLARQAFSRSRGGSSANGAQPSAVGAADPEPADPDGEDWPALQGYRRAMDYAIRRAGAQSFSYSIEFIHALHFMLTEHGRTRHSGSFRSEGIQVLDVEGKVVYLAPPADRVPALMHELVEGLNGSTGESPWVRAAMAHLNMLRIHPFHDGNGRMARCLQNLVLMHASANALEVASLEEYAGRHMKSYNVALRSTGDTWEPHRDTTAWIRFCLEAHYAQAIALFTKVSELERLEDDLREHLANRHALPDVTLQSLGKVFGARPAVVGRWWRMRPERVLEHLIAETQD